MCFYVFCVVCVCEILLGMGSCMWMAKSLAYEAHAGRTDEKERGCLLLMNGVQQRGCSRQQQRPLLCVCVSVCVSGIDHHVIAITFGFTLCLSGRVIVRVSFFPFVASLQKKNKTKQKGTRIRLGSPFARTRHSRNRR